MFIAYETKSEHVTRTNTIKQISLSITTNKKHVQRRSTLSLWPNFVERSTDPQ